MKTFADFTDPRYAYRLQVVYLDVPVPILSIVIIQNE